MLIRFTTPCVLGTTEYASGDEADLPNDVANATLSLGRAVRVLPNAVLTAAPTAAAATEPQPALQPEPPAAPDDDAARPKRR